MISKKSTTYGLASVTFGLVLGFMAANWKATAVSAAAEPPNPILTAPQGGGQDKPVEQIEHRYLLQLDTQVYRDQGKRNGG